MPPSTSSCCPADNPQSTLLQVQTVQHGTLIEDAAKKVLLSIWPEVIRRIRPELDELADARQQHRTEPGPSHGSHPVAESGTAPGHLSKATSGAASAPEEQARVQSRPPSAAAPPSERPETSEGRAQQQDREGFSGGGGPADTSRQASPLHLALQKLSLPSPTPLPPLHRGTRATASAAVCAGEVMVRRNEDEDGIPSLCALASVAAVAVQAAAGAAAAAQPLQLQPRQKGAHSRFRSPGDAIRSKSGAPGRPRWQRWGAIRAALSAADLVCDSAFVASGAFISSFLPLDRQGRAVVLWGTSE